MEKKWQIWYKTVLLPLREYAPGQPYSTELEALIKRDDVDLALLAADTDRTQDYVFESAKLPEIRGGSERLKELNEIELPRIIAEAGLPNEECVLYAGGGGFLALVPASLSEMLATQIEAVYPQKTGQATISCRALPLRPAQVLFGLEGSQNTWQKVSRLKAQLGAKEWQRIEQAYTAPSGEEAERAFERSQGFGQLVQVMGHLLRQKKDLPTTAPFVESFPFAVRCKLCQIRPAQRIYPYFDEKWPLCDVCMRKARIPDRENGAGKKSGFARERRSRQMDQFWTWLGETELEAKYWGNKPLEEVYLPQDLNELGSACLTRPGYIAFIYADGNRMGQLLEMLPSPTAYQEFSDALGEAIKAAAYQSLAENLHPIPVDKSDSANKTGKTGEKDYIHPMEPLVMGGDDVMLIVPADAALPIAARLSQIFEKEMKQRVSATIRETLPADLQHPTISVGVVIADSHNPVRVLQQISKELCQNAKQRVDDERRKSPASYTSAIDFLLLKSQSMLRRDVKQLRKIPPYYYAEGADAGRSLTAAPYRLDEFTRLLEILKEMRQVDFPQSQLRGVVAAMHKGRQYGSVHYLYQRARLKARLGGNQARKNILQRLTEIWPYQEKRDPIPWHRKPNTDKREFVSIVPDLLELYPFTPRFSERPPSSREIAQAELWQEIFREADDENQN